MRCAAEIGAHRVTKDRQPKSDARYGRKEIPGGDGAHCEEVSHCYTLPLLGSVTVAYCRPWSIRLEPCLVPATFRKGVVAAAERTEHTLSSLAGRPCAEPGSLQTRGCRLVVQCRTRKLKT